MATATIEEVMKSLDDENTLETKEPGIEIDPKKFDPSRHNGMLSIQSKRTGDWRTFKIKTVKGGNLKGKRILSLLTGPDREDPASWLGFAFVNDNGEVRLWRKHENNVYEVFAKMIARPADWLEKAVYRIEGRCRRCNRPLTVPESVDYGVGPECRKKMGF